MKLKGEAQKFPGMYIFDSIMRRTFGRSVKLVSYYGPVQMCVFGLEYEYKPKHYKFKVECERGGASDRSRKRNRSDRGIYGSGKCSAGNAVPCSGGKGKGSGRKLVQYGLELYGVREVTVNEQNPDAVGFYEHLGFATYKRTDLDEEGNPYPLLYMRSEERERGE